MSRASCETFCLLAHLGLTSLRLVTRDHQMLAFRYWKCGDQLWPAH